MPAQEVALAFDRVTKRFGKLIANDAISLDVRAGEVLALLGENGAGKTTLMNILFGHYQADEGAIEVFGKSLPAGSTRAALQAGIGMVHQHFTLAANLSVLENIQLGTEPLWSWHQKRGQARRKLEDLANQFGLVVDPDARISQLSVGERQRVEILKALYRDARILILDEPTAVLTPQETDSLLDTLRSLKSEGLAVIFISHKLHEILAIADRIAVLRRGRLIGCIDRAEASRDGLAQMMVGEPVERPKPTPIEPGEPILQIDQLNLKSPDGRPQLDGLSLAVRAHEIVGIAGVAGNGQSALADVLCGLRTDFTGEVAIEGKATERHGPAEALSRKIGRIPEDRHAEGIVAGMSLWENTISEDLQSGHGTYLGTLIDQNAARQKTRALIDEFDVRCQGPEQDVRLLSGGNMQKLILARVLSASPRLIIANQPVRGLDEGAIAFVQRRLLQARKDGAAILLISEDLDELLALADRLVVMHNGILSPSFRPGERTTAEIGLMMAGGTHQHAA